MKKFTFTIFAILLIASGCTSKTKTMVCTRTANQNNLKLDLTYKIDYQGQNVTKVKSVEKITSEDVSQLENYKNSIESIYKSYENIDHYNYSITIKGDVLTSLVTINYEKVDTDKLIKVDSANGQLIKNGKINISDIKSAYENIGASCKNS